MERLLVPLDLHGIRVFMRRLSAFEQLKIPSISLEIFYKLTEISSLDFKSLWASSNNAALLYLALFNSYNEDISEPCFSKPADLLNCLGLDEVAKLSNIYNSSFPVEDMH